MLEVKSLPIDGYLQKISAAYSQTPNVILTAPPGSGKTLRVPALLARELLAQKSKKKIVVLVPKRIAAVSAANRIAEENNWRLGEEVGYQVRFDQKFSALTKLLFMTEGVFVKRMTLVDFMNEIELIVFDEFHERSSLNDIAFGFCYEQQMLADENHKLKILVMSATLNTGQLEKYLENAVHIDIDLKPYPLEIIKSKKSQKLQFDFALVDHIVDVAKEALQKQKKDLLIFLPGLYEIKQVQNKLNQNLPQLLTEILHGSINLEEQRRILSPANSRRIILSTNIAESSLTLPSVDCVIDSGLEKKSVFESKIGFQRLELKRISLFSARQRAGRAARVGPGACYQLWHESDELSMSEQIEPEVLKSSLLEETLILNACGIKAPQHFSWLTPPRSSFEVIQKKFKTWGFTDDSQQITALGKLVQRCPLDLERGLLFILLAQNGFQKPAARFLAYLETTDFSKINHPVDLDDLFLNDLGRKIENQLNQFLVVQPQKSNNLFLTSLIKIFLKYFPEKMAQRKEGASGLSSLGRGLQFQNYLIQKDHTYFLLLAGRDLSDTITQINFAIGFSQKEFEELSEVSQTIETNYSIDFEKKMIYKQQRKLSGFFTLSVGTKSPLDLKNDQALFKKIFKDHMSEFIQQHSSSAAYFKKINFLKKRAELLKYIEADFDFLNQIESEIDTALSDVILSITDFLNYDLYSLLIYLTPDQIKKDLQNLNSQFQLPNGKSVPIDYDCELAPQISIRIQDALGLFKTPHLLQDRLKISIELLSPNYRPAQITSDLENFWKKSYLDVRKDFRARYPKHDWPENPLDWKPEMSKRLKK
jgi:ATP-dependent helicase HrpB